MTRRKSLSPIYLIRTTDNLHLFLCLNIIYRVSTPLSIFAFLPHLFFAFFFSVIFGNTRDKDSLTQSKYFFKDESLFGSGIMRVSICLIVFFLRLDIAMDNSEYHSFEYKVSNELNAYDEVRFASIEERKDTGVLSSETIRLLCHGNNRKDLLILSY